LVTGRSVETVVGMPVFGSRKLACTLTVEPAVKLVSPACGAAASAAACVMFAVVSWLTIGIMFERFQRTPRQRPISAFISASVSAYWCELTKVGSFAMSCSTYGSTTPANCPPLKDGAPSCRSVAIAPESRSVLMTSPATSAETDDLFPAMMSVPPPPRTFCTSRSISSPPAVPRRSRAIWMAGCFAVIMPTSVSETTKPHCSSTPETEVTTSGVESGVMPSVSGAAGSASRS
jgi:hypothetical protein